MLNKRASIGLKIIAAGRSMLNKLTSLFNRKRKYSPHLEKTLIGIVSKSPEDVPVLNIVMANDLIATLFYDGEEEKYGLIYHEKYNDYEGLLPFNIDLSKDESVKIGELYYSKELWYPFSARIPSKSRTDCIERLKEYNLTLDDHPLKILSSIGRISIANRWKLEPFHS